MTASRTLRPGSRFAPAERHFPLQVWITARQKRALAALAKKTRRTLTSLVREMIDRGVAS